MSEEIQAHDNHITEAAGFNAGCTREYLEHLFDSGLDKDRFMRDCKRYAGSMDLTDFLKKVSMGLYEEFGFGVDVSHYVRILAVVQRFRADARKPAIL